MRVWNSTKENQQNSGYANDIIHDRLYFGSKTVASIITPRDYRVFVNGVGQQTKNISTNAIVTQSEADTSLEGRGGTIPNGEAFVITAIGINVVVCNVQATSPFTDDGVTSIDVTPLYRVNPMPLHDAILSQCTFELYRNSDDRLERGNISEYPVEFGRSGFAGGGAATVPAVTSGPLQASYVVNPTVYAESAGYRFRQLTVYNTLASLDDFYGVFKVNRQIDLASTLLTGYIDFYLCGRLVTNTTRDQYVAGFVSQ